jgi:hypothetical protein
MTTTAASIRRLPIALQPELGPWTPDHLNRLLARTSQIADPGMRFSMLARELLDTPFCDESSLPLTEPGTVRVRFETFDCVTFIYYVIAMTHARNFEEFARNFRFIRYRSYPNAQSFIHYSWNSFRKLIRAGMLRRITTEIADGWELPEKSVTLGVKGDGHLFLGDDFGKRGDRNLGVTVTEPYIPAERAYEFTPRLATGDILVMVAPVAVEEYPLIERHLISVYRPDESRRGPEDTFLLHCSRNRVLTSEGPFSGVTISRLRVPGQNAVYPFGPPRPLYRYIAEHPDLWKGVLVYRLTEPRRR